MCISLNQFIVCKVCGQAVGVVDLVPRMLDDDVCEAESSHSVRRSMIGRAANLQS